MRFIKYVFILSLFSPAIVFSEESVDLCSLVFVSDKQYTPNSIMAYLQRSARVFTSVSDRALQAGLSGIPFAKRLRGAKTNSPANKAEEILGRLNRSQKRAVEAAYLVGSGEKGKDGSLAGIGNYTQAQLRRKTEILQQAGLSPFQRRKLMESGVVGDDFIRNAGIRLEQDLQAIRNSPQEPLLIEQGFKPSYYAGVDQAREFNRLHEYLREIQVDPNRTHIPYFADQVEKTISDFERGLRTQNITGDLIYHRMTYPEFLEKRLKILEDFKKEARKRVENQDVTYDWWAKFNTKLSILASAKILLHRLASRFITFKKVDDLYFVDVLRIREEIEEMMSGGVSFYVGEKEFMTVNDALVFKEFPEKMMFFTTDELGIMAFNTLGNNAHFAGLSGYLENTKDGVKDSCPFWYLKHDFVHVGFSVELPEGVSDRMNNISNKSDRKKAELALFIYRHEGGGGSHNNHSQSALEEMMLLSNPSLSYRTMMERWLDPDDLQRFLPDGMNVKDELEVQSFLRDSATVFGGILSDLN